MLPEVKVNINFISGRHPQAEASWDSDRRGAQACDTDAYQ